MEFKQINHTSGEDKTFTNQIIAQFLYTHLEEYGDKIEDILKDEVNQSYFISQLKQYINSSKTISQIGDEI